MDNASVDAQDALVVEIARLAAQYLYAMVSHDLAEDLSQQVALDCLCRLRSGELIVTRASVAGLARTMAHRRALDWLRTRRSSVAPEAAYNQSLHDHAPSWMRPDMTLDEAELSSFYSRVLAGLRPRTRLAFVMVRERRMTYRAVAAQLGLSPAAVCSHIVSVQRRFRAELTRMGLRAPAAITNRLDLSARRGSNDAIESLGDHDPVHTIDDLQHQGVA